MVLHDHGVSKLAGILVVESRLVEGSSGQILGRWNARADGMGLRGRVETDRSGARSKLQAGLRTVELVPTSHVARLEPLRDAAQPGLTCAAYTKRAKLGSHRFVFLWALGVLSSSHEIITWSYEVEILPLARR